MGQQKSNKGKPGMTHHNNKGASPGKKNERARATQTIADGKARAKANGTSVTKKKGR